MDDSTSLGAPHPANVASAVTADDSNNRGSVSNAPNAEVAGSQRYAGEPATVAFDRGASIVPRPPKVSVRGKKGFKKKVNSHVEGDQSVPIGDKGAIVLLSGVDSLDVGLYVEFPESWPRIVAKLGELKRKASRNGGEVAGEGRCLVLASGKPNYPFHVQFANFHLYLSRSRGPVGDTPNVFVSLNSQLLWERGPRAAVDHVRSELSALADGVVIEERINRCDLAVDTLVPGGLTDDLLRSHAVCRSEQQVIYLEKNGLNTFYQGKRGAEIMLRIYDKSVEIEASGKAWFLLLWQITENVDVWRCEFQLRRPALKGMGINSLNDLNEKQGRVWRYLTQEWFSLRQHDNENASRRTALPVWQIIQDCAQQFGVAGERIKRVGSVPSIDTSFLVKRVRSAVVGFAARTGIDDEAEAWRQMGIKIAEESVHFKQDVQRKRIELGIHIDKEAA